ncbi:MAG: glycoside hydrolase family 130 protein [Vulcanimicrobiota bacterium]
MQDSRRWPVVSVKEPGMTRTLQTSPANPDRVGSLPEWFPLQWTKLDTPILSPRERGFDSRNVYNVAACQQGNTTTLLVRGETREEAPTLCTGRLGLAFSEDGVTFHREVDPVLVPDAPYEARGVEDPRLIEVDGTYYLTYTSYDGNKARLCLATSPDLRNWRRYGPLFPEFPEFDHWTKSGAILARPGRHVMYFGDFDIWMATSDNLTDWEYRSQPVIARRPDSFESRLIEPGPPPFLTRHGIVLIYNCADRRNRYSTTAALFHPDRPWELLDRLEEPFLKPSLDWEIYGYVNHVTFAEGLVRRGDRFYLYYGGADRHVGLAQATVPKGYLAD